MSFLYPTILWYIMTISHRIYPHWTTIHSSPVPSVSCRCLRRLIIQLADLTSFHGLLGLWHHLDRLVMLKWFYYKILSGWWFQPLWKIWKSAGMILPNIWKNVPNHQPVYIYIIMFINPTCVPWYIQSWLYKHVGDFGDIMVQTWSRHRTLNGTKKPFVG
jgi:hypothetical protein